MEQLNDRVIEKIVLLPRITCTYLLYELTLNSGYNILIDVGIATSFDGSIFALCAN